MNDYEPGCNMEAPKPLTTEERCKDCGLSIEVGSAVYRGLSDDSVWHADSATCFYRLRKIIKDYERGDEVARLKLCERRLANVTRWLDVNQPDVFRRGLWDCIDQVTI